MEVKEFKAWLEGFKEGVGEAPTQEQWEKVLKKIGSLQETKVSLNPYKDFTIKPKEIWNTPIRYLEDPN